MEANDNAFIGPIPAIYDRVLVPLLFAGHAADLAGRVARTRPQDILEIAAGTGALSRSLARAVSMRASLMVTDLNQAMLDQAAKGLSDPRVQWRQADALALPFEAESFDAAVCQFGVMFFPDKVRGFAEALRVLKPGGVFLFNVWSEVERNLFSIAILDVLATLFPEDPPRFLVRTPFGYQDRELIHADLDAAGFTEITFETVETMGHAPSAREAAIGFCQGSPLRGEIEARRPGELQAVSEACGERMAERFGAGPFEGLLVATVVEARRPN